MKGSSDMFSEEIDLSDSVSTAVANVVMGAQDIVKQRQRISANSLRKFLFMF